mgnify:FL=1
MLGLSLILLANSFTARPPIIDAHTHLHAAAAQRIVAIQDENGIGVMVNLSGGHPGPFGPPPGVALAAALPGRVINAYTPDWSAIDHPAWGVAQAEGLTEAVRRWDFRALKISKALGLYVRDDAGVLIDSDDPRLDPLWERAGELGVPVFIHTADPKAFWEPPTADNERAEELSFHPDWSFWNTGVPARMDLLAATERVIAAHPLTSFVLVHFGNNAEELDYVARILGAYPNAFVDISARVPEIGRHPAEAVRDVFLRFHDRILFGSDIGISPYGLVLGSSGGDEPTDRDVKPFFDTHFRFLETNDRGFAHPTPIQGRWTIDGIGLPDAVLRDVYHDNAARLLKLPVLAP